MPALQSPLITLGPFLGLNTTRSPFYLNPGDGSTVSNVDISENPGMFTTSEGRQQIAAFQVPSGYALQCVAPFTSYVGSEGKDGTINEVKYYVWCARDLTTGDSYYGYVNAQTGANVTATSIAPFTQAVQFGDALYTNGGNKIFFSFDGSLAVEDWQIQVDKSLPYNIFGSQAPKATSGISGVFQYAYTVRRSAHWRADGGTKGIQARCIGVVYCAAPGQVTLTVTRSGVTYTTQPVTFKGPGKGQSTELLSEQVAAELAQAVNSDPIMGTLFTAFPNFTQHGHVENRYIAVFVNKPGSDGNNYKMYLTITNHDGGNRAGPASPGNPFQQGADTGGEALLNPTLSTYQESSPVITPTFTVANDNAHIPCLLIPSSVDAKALISDVDTYGETYYGYLYRSSNLNPTFVGVDYLTNLNQGTDVNGNACFLDPYTDAQIQNNVILELHQDPPPMVGQVYPGPALSTLNTLNGGPPESFDQSDLKESFTYLNPAFITKHQSRMFAMTNYPTQPTQHQGMNQWRNHVTMQTQLWYSNFGIPYAWDDVNQLLLLGSEDASGNYQIGSDNGAPWSPNGLLTDYPIGLASTGSILVLFKRGSSWILFGDSPAEFNQGLRRAFNMGCGAANSITPAEGGVFWTADNPIGDYFFNGNSPAYISEDVRASLSSLEDVGELSLGAGGYGSDHVRYLSFPPSKNPNSPAFGPGITFCYSTAVESEQGESGGKWFTLPYGSNILFDPGIGVGQWGMASQDGSDITLSLLRTSIQDLGQNVTGTWVDGVTDSKLPGVRKWYKYITLNAPAQAADVVVTLFIDGVEAFSWEWNLDAINDPNVVNVPWGRTVSLPDSCQGYLANIQLDVTNRSTTNQATIFNVIVTGEQSSKIESTASFDGTYTNVSP